MVFKSVNKSNRIVELKQLLRVAIQIKNESQALKIRYR